MRLKCNSKKRVFTRPHSVYGQAPRKLERPNDWASKIVTYRDFAGERTSARRRAVLHPRSMSRVYSAAACALAGAILAGCNRSPREESRTAAGILPPMTAALTAARTTITQAESDSAVATVLRSAAAPDTAVGYRVVLWDFRARTRYLILAFLSLDSDGHGRPALYAIEDGRASAPYVFKDDERVAVRHIADFDHDARPDVAMCVSLEAREEVVVARVVGYRNPTWYLIPAASSAIPCASPPPSHGVRRRV